MSFISYAQNFEDVMLWRALKHIKNGFYVDIGAWSPDVDSVTRAFYERGWHGVNIEPNSELYAHLIQKRLRDINLCLAVSDFIGTAEMNFLTNPGLSTLDNSIAEKHQLDGWKNEKQKVEITTLKEVCKNYISLEQEIHFLKIDVEGAEAAVIQGANWHDYRPWILIVEATLPMSQKLSYGEWEDILLAANYQFVYFDGLNRFYIAKEHPELLEAFSSPPNIFDEFELNNFVCAVSRADDLEKLLVVERAENLDTSKKLQNIYKSRSWRIIVFLQKIKRKIFFWKKT